MWTSPITFERPAILLLLPLALFAVRVVASRSTSFPASLSRKQGLILRSVIVCLVLLSASGLSFHRVTDRLTTVYAVDVSDSISTDERREELRFITESLKSQGPRDGVGVVVFGREPFVEFPPSATLDPSSVRSDVPGDATNIQAGINAAAGVMPSDTGRRIVLFSDGLENVGDVLSTVQSLKQQGVQVDIAPLNSDSSILPEALVERIVAPSHAMIRSPYGLRVVLSSTVPQLAELTLARDGKPIGRRSLKLAAGKTAVYFDDTVQSAGVYRYTANLEPTVDTNLRNNNASSVVLVHGQPRVLLIRNSNEPLPSAVLAALKSESIAVDESSPSTSPSTVAGLASYDSVLLSDVAAGDLSDSQMNAVAQANEEFGVGLGMIGGVNSFGSGGYIGTPIEDALPVKMTPKDRKRIPAADVVIVLDASGSMSAEENGVEKVEIAARAALNLLGALQPKDRVAVLAVTETASIVMPLVSPQQAAHYVPAIDSVEAGGGGIDCRNGLEAAYTMLETSDASIKHVIICPDTTDSEQQEGCVALATAVYKVDKISTSVCGIGQWTDSDVPFQRALATAGHGQLFVANQAGNLPQFFQRDVQSTEQKLFLEGNFNVVAAGNDPVASLTTPAPSILGYNLVDPKPDAVVPLTLTGHNDPLFVYWRHGIGKSFAYTSDDDSHWSRQWTTWQNFPGFWAHVVRWSLKGQEDESFQTQVSNIKGTGKIVVDAYNGNGFSTDAQFGADIAGPSGTVTQVRLTETAPGRYESSFSTADVGSYLVQVENLATGGRQTASVSTSYSPEYADLTPDTALLQALATQSGGIMLSNPKQVFRRGLPISLGTESLVDPLLFVAAVLFVLDVAWRRMGWRVQRSSAAVVGNTLKDGAIAAAGSIKRRAVILRPDTISGANLGQSVGLDPKFLKERTAVRSELEDDNPFPFVATLPPRTAQERRQEPSKEDQ